MTNCPCIKPSPLTLRETLARTRREQPCCGQDHQFPACTPGLYDTEAMPDPGSDNTQNPQQADEQPLDPRLPRRLLVAFLIILGLTVLSAITLPRANLSIPWFVFALAYLAILAAALAPLFEGREEPPDEEQGDIAGRIGRGDRP